MSGQCECNGCHDCSPRQGPCRRAAVVGAEDNRCSECHEAKVSKDVEVTLPAPACVPKLTLLGVGSC